MIIEIVTTMSLLVNCSMSHHLQHRCSCQTNSMLSRYFKKGSELALGTGAFVAGLEFSGDCKAEVVGKPSKTFFDLAVARFDGIASEEILMVGDDIRDDVIGMKIVENDH